MRWSSHCYPRRNRLIYPPLETTTSLPVRVRIRTNGPHVTRVEPQNFAYTQSDSVTVYFDPDHPLDKAKLDNTTYVLKDGKATPQQTGVTPVLNPDNSVTLAYTDLPPDLYTLTVYTTKTVDIFGNKGQADYTTQLFKPVGGELPLVSPGIHSPTGPYVPFPEYLKPPPEPNGFNPGDHVETRVARLYYYRDAHRVAQVINRTAQSYNRAAVDMERQLADRARYIADKLKFRPTRKARRLPLLKIVRARSSFAAKWRRPTKTPTPTRQASPARKTTCAASRCQSSAKASFNYADRSKGSMKSAR